jgi:hypothetical protein
MTRSQFRARGSSINPPQNKSASASGPAISLCHRFQDIRQPLKIDNDRWNENNQLAIRSIKGTCPVGKPFELKDLLLVATKSDARIPSNRVTNCHFSNDI